MIEWPVPPCPGIEPGHSSSRRIDGLLSLDLYPRNVLALGYSEIEAYRAEFGTLTRVGGLTAALAGGVALASIASPLGASVILAVLNASGIHLQRWI
jgi:hypothetical protein